MPYFFIHKIDWAQSHGTDFSDSISHPDGFLSLILQSTRHYPFFWRRKNLVFHRTIDFFSFIVKHSCPTTISWHKYVNNLHFCTDSFIFIILFSLIGFVVRSMAIVKRVFLFTFSSAVWPTDARSATGRRYDLLSDANWRTRVRDANLFYNRRCRRRQFTWRALFALRLHAAHTPLNCCYSYIHF